MKTELNKIERESEPFSQAKMIGSRSTTGVDGTVFVADIVT